MKPPVARKFEVSCELDYQLNKAATFLFSMKAQESEGQTVLSETVRTLPEVTVEDFQIDRGMNRFCRFRTYNPGWISLFYGAEVESTTRLVDVADLISGEVAEIDPDGLQFLFPSRYCQSDLILQEAESMFGDIGSAYEIASAVSDWIFENVSYVSGSSGESCSAVDTFEKREGVCRDFAHLGIALCRALCVPARYASVYAHQLDPQDFHACFEVFINGVWYLFDPTRLAPLNGLVRIATGRDAADVAVCTFYGDAILTKSVVECVALDTNFLAITRDGLVESGQAIVLC